VSLLDEGVEQNAVMNGLKAFLERTHLTHLAPRVAHVVEELYTTREKERTAHIVVGRPSSAKLADRIKEAIVPEADTHIATTEEALIGGFRVVHAHRVTDTSIRHHLDQLRTHLHA
jgi:F0F1-type ATP synthase delta subunit